MQIVIIPIITWPTRLLRAMIKAGVAPSEEVAQQLSQHFNTIISGLVKASPITSRRHIEMAYANLGESFGGSWRNEVG